MDEKRYTDEEQALIDGVEYAIDYRLPISEEDYKKYLELTSNKN